MVICCCCVPLLALCMSWFIYDLFVLMNNFFRLYCSTVNIFIIYDCTEYNFHILGEIRTCWAYYVSLYLHYVQLILLESHRLPSHTLFFSFCFPFCLSGCKIICRLGLALLILFSFVHHLPKLKKIYPLKFSDPRVSWICAALRQWMLKGNTGKYIEWKYWKNYSLQINLRLKCPWSLGQLLSDETEMKPDLLYCRIF